MGSFWFSVLKLECELNPLSPFSLFLFIIPRRQLLFQQYFVNSNHHLRRCTIKYWSFQSNLYTRKKSPKLLLGLHPHPNILGMETIFKLPLVLQQFSSTLPAQNTFTCLWFFLPYKLYQTVCGINSRVLDQYHPCLENSSVFSLLKWKIWEMGHY